MSDTSGIQIHIDIDTDPTQKPPPKHVDACTFSPNGRHLATFSATEGIITIWNVDQLEKKEKTYYWQNNDTVLKSRKYRVEKMSFESPENSKRMMSDVDFALSNEGKADYILSLKISRHQANTEPTMFYR